MNEDPAKIKIYRPPKFPNAAAPTTRKSRIRSGKGIIRAHGCSCHSIEALRAAAKEPWVQVDLARVNPIGWHMDADPDIVVSVLREMRAAGKAVIGMKIPGQGDMRSRQDEALKYSLSLDVLHAFIIGAESRTEQEDLLHRISAVNA